MVIRQEFLHKNDFIEVPEDLPRFKVLKILMMDRLNNYIERSNWNVKTFCSIIIMLEYFT